MWTSLPEIRAKILRLWESGDILSSVVADTCIFPYRICGKLPKAKDIAQSVLAVRSWVDAIRATKNIRVEWEEMNSRIVGRNSYPVAIYVDSLDDALEIIGKKKEFRRFTDMIAFMRQRVPELEEWLRNNPMKALSRESSWESIIEVLVWMKSHPRPGIYIREADIPSVHTKVIETSIAILGELLDIVLPKEHIREEITPANINDFCERYGFRGKPQRYVRFRILDVGCNTLSNIIGDADVEIPDEVFSRLALPARNVFIVENEVTFLAFPQLDDSIVIYGGGNGVEKILRASSWLRDRNMVYWGDLDLDGFRILSNLRKSFPNVLSVMMDLETLQKFSSLWTTESNKREISAEMERLTEKELAVCRYIRFEEKDGARIRLEQERIGFGYVKTKCEECVRHSAPKDVG